MGYTIETSRNPTFHIGDYVFVSGIIGIPNTWETPECGIVVGLALEIEQDEPPPESEPEWQYHIMLDSSIHIYSTENQMKKVYSYSR